MSSLMRPLVNDDLKPRAYAQAAAKQEAPQAAPQEPSPQEDAPEQPQAWADPPFEPAADAVQTEEEAPSEGAEEPFAALDELLGDIPQEPEDDEADLDAPDAVPSEQMPAPAYVPLYETPAPPPKKRRGWIWLIILIVLGGAGYAAWQYGILEKIWVFVIDKTASIRYNLGIMIQSIKSRIS